MNYLPFDLETALKHPERVVTRDGRKVQELYYFKTKTPYPLVSIVNGNDGSHNLDGTFYSTVHSRDLFLLPEVNECWVNVYSNELGHPYVKGFSYQTKENAKFIAGTEKIGYIKTIRITNEPE